MSRYKKIRCPFCNKVMTESELDYDFDIKSEPTNRYVCGRCKKIVFYSVKTPATKENSLTANKQ